DAHRGLERLASPDAFEGGIDADSIRHFLDRLNRRVAALDEDVSRTDDRASCWRFGFRLRAMILAAPRRRAAITAQRPTAPSPTTCGVNLATSALATSKSHELRSSGVGADNRTSFSGSAT